MVQEIPEHMLHRLRCHKCDLYLSISPVYVTMERQNICGRCVRFYQEHGKELPVATKNSAYEITALVLNFPCRYATDGCPAKLSIASMKVHEDHCTFNIY